MTVPIVEQMHLFVHYRQKTIENHFLILEEKDCVELLHPSEQRVFLPLPEPGQGNLYIGVVVDGHGILVQSDHVRTY